MASLLCPILVMVCRDCSEMRRSEVSHAQLCLGTLVVIIYPVSVSGCLQCLLVFEESESRNHAYLCKSPLLPNNSFFFITSSCWFQCSYSITCFLPLSWSDSYFAASARWWAPNGQWPFFMPVPPYHPAGCYVGRVVFRRCSSDTIDLDSHQKINIMKLSMVHSQWCNAITTVFFSIFL